MAIKSNIQSSLSYLPNSEGKYNNAKLHMNESYC
jgi:hypothetical protein